MKFYSLSAFLYLSGALIGVCAFAQVPASFEKPDLQSLCGSAPAPAGLVVMDNGFCHHFLEAEAERLSQGVLKTLEPGKVGVSCTPAPSSTPKDRWKIRFYASHSFTTYFNSDVKFDTSRYQVEIKDYEWAERGSRSYFNPKYWGEEGRNPFQFIDEPSNTFTLSIEKDGHEFFLTSFHPKYLQAQGQVKPMAGTIDGQQVNGVLPVPFVENRNTYRQITLEAGYGHRFKLVDSRYGNLTYVPSVSAGVMIGGNVSRVRDPVTGEITPESQDAFRVQGLGGSLTNRLEFNTPKERFGVFYENKLSGFALKHGFEDGTQQYNLGFMGNSVGMKFMLYNPANHKKK
jgi:hypothetical protein